MRQTGGGAAPKSQPPHSKIPLINCSSPFGVLLDAFTGIRDLSCPLVSTPYQPSRDNWSGSCRSVSERASRLRISQDQTIRVRLSQTAQASLVLSVPLASHSSARRRHERKLRNDTDSWSASLTIHERALRVVESDPEG